MAQELKEWVIDPETGRLLLLGIDELEAQRAAIAMRPRPSTFNYIIGRCKSGALRVSRDAGYIVKALYGRMTGKKS